MLSVPIVGKRIGPLQLLATLNYQLDSLQEIDDIIILYLTCCLILDDLINLASRLASTVLRLLVIGESLEIVLVHFQIGSGILTLILCSRKLSVFLSTLLIDITRVKATSSLAMSAVISKADPAEVMTTLTGHVHAPRILLDRSLAGRTRFRVSLQPIGRLTFFLFFLPPILGCLTIARLVCVITAEKAEMGATGACNISDELSVLNLLADHLAVIVGTLLDAVGMSFSILHGQPAPVLLSFILL